MLISNDKEKSKSVKQKHLSKLKTKIRIIYAVVAVISTALSSIYSYYAVSYIIYDFTDNIYS